MLRPHSRPTPAKTFRDIRKRSPYGGRVTKCEGIRLQGMRNPNAKAFGYRERVTKCEGIRLQGKHSATGKELSPTPELAGAGIAPGAAGLAAIRLANVGLV